MPPSRRRGWCGPGACCSRGAHRAGPWRPLGEPLGFGSQALPQSSPRAGQRGVQTPGPHPMHFSWTLPPQAHRRPRTPRNGSQNFQWGSQGSGCLIPGLGVMVWGPGTLGDTGGEGSAAISRALPGPQWGRWLAVPLTSPPTEFMPAPTPLEPHSVRWHPGKASLAWGVTGDPTLCEATSLPRTPSPAEPWE